MKNPNNTIKKSSPALAACGVLSAALGVIALILLHAYGFPYTVYVTVLMICVALSAFLLFTVLFTGLAYRISAGGSHPKVRKWQRLLSLSLAALIVAPLAVILPAAQGIPYTGYLPIFLLLLIPAATLLILSVISWLVAVRQLKKDCRRTLF